MYAKDPFSPYLNRLVSQLHQNATARLEFNCKDGKGNVNVYHDPGEVEKVSSNLHELN